MKNYRKKIQIILGLIFFICFTTPINSGLVNLTNNNHSLRSSGNGITIITPENKTYTKAMDGYYPATFGFENVISGEKPTEWDILVEESGIISVLESLDGHNKVLDMNQISVGSYIYNYLQKSFSESISGTIEFWIRTTDSSKRPSFIYIGDTEVYYSCGINFRFYDGKIQYYDDSFHDILNFISNKWYHFRIDWDCSDMLWHLWIDGKQMDAFKILTPIVLLL